MKALFGRRGQTEVRRGTRERLGEVTLYGPTQSPTARIGDVSFDQAAQAEALVRRARPQQPGISGPPGPPDFDAKLGVEREDDRDSYDPLPYLIVVACA